MPLLDSAHKVVRVTISGTMLGGGEEWQTGFYMGSLTQDASAPTQGFADAVRDAWTTFWSANQSHISSYYIFTAVKCAMLLKNGDYDQSFDVVNSYPTPGVAGGGGSLQYPPQVSLVATTIGGSGKGLGGKGRMYLPGVYAAIDGSGHLGSTECQSIATNLAAFFNSVDSSIDAPGHAVNVSRGHKNLLGAGARNVPINGIRVGNVFDTQRRRRNALVETYSTAVVAD